MTDRRAGNWLAGLVLGAISGLGVLVAGILGAVILVAAVLLIAIHRPRGLSAAGLVTGLGLVWTVLFARVALTCGGPLDPGTSTCGAGDLSVWIAASVVLFAVGLVASALALQRTRR
jgi:hypothetical protein